MKIKEILIEIMTNIINTCRLREEGGKIGL